MNETNSIETTRENYEAARAELNRLQAEESRLAADSAKALQSLDVKEVERLRRRRVELPSYLEVARVRTAQCACSLLEAQLGAREQSVAELKEKAVAAGHESDREKERANQILRDADIALHSAHNAWSNEELKLRTTREQLARTESELQALLSGQAARAA
jgi:hypothetical protein